MKNLKYLFMIASVAFVAISCGDEGDSLASQIEGSPNFVGFIDGSANLSGVADGTVYPLQLPVYVSGPSFKDLTGTFTATIAIDAQNSTAVEGTHFSIPNKTVTLTSENNYLATVEVQMLTTGIETPQASNPFVSIYFESATGSGVIGSEKRTTITFLYLCPSDLSGDYQVVITRGDGNVYTYADVIAETGVGQYRGTSVGHWAPGAIGGTPGFDFIEICSVITVPEQNLVSLYSNLVFPIGKPEDSFVNETTGVMTIKYGITFAAGPREYTAVYTPQ